MLKQLCGRCFNSAKGVGSSIWAPSLGGVKSSRTRSFRSSPPSRFPPSYAPPGVVKLTALSVGGAFSLLEGPSAKFRVEFREVFRGTFCAALFCTKLIEEMPRVGTNLLPLATDAIALGPVEIPPFSSVFRFEVVVVVMAAAVVVVAWGVIGGTIVLVLGVAIFVVAVGVIVVVIVASVVVEVEMVGDIDPWAFDVQLDGKSLVVVDVLQAGNGLFVISDFFFFTALN